MMSSETQNTERKCPSCGSDLQAEFVYCPTCGETLPAADEFTGLVGDQDLADFINSADQHLSEAGTNAAESAFGLGCYLGFIPVAILIVIVFLIGFRNWIVIALVGLVATLFTTGIAALLSRRARETNIRTTYYREVEPQIETYLAENAITRAEFETAASQVLTGDAPLLTCLTWHSQQDQG
jgi:hypothetical protein